MILTRRSMLQKTSLAALATCPSLLSVGCQARPYPAVRIFFCGAWLFCGDDNGGMNAISRDMQPMGTGPAIPHIFPAGIWKDKDFDANSSSDSRSMQLPKNSNNAGSTVSPYRVSINDARNTPPTVTALFKEASEKYSFHYLKNGDMSNPMKIDGTVCDLIRISLPIPSRIVTAAFLGKSTYQGGMMTGPAAPPGVATAHLFEYDDAKSMVFSTAAKEIFMDPLRHFHFHTLPQPHKDKPQTVDVDHGPQMFAGLINAVQWRGKSLDQSGLKLVGPSDGSKQVSGIGPYIKKFIPDITEGELEFSTSVNIDGRLHNGDIASCSGSGFGIDGNPCSC